MYSQKTTPYELPQWLGSDKANWDVDLNAAFLIINDLFVNMQDYLSKLQNKVDGDVISDIEKVNNQITDIISRLDENDEQVVAIKKKVNFISEMVDKLQTDYENLNTTVENNEAAVGAKIASIEDDIESVRGDITTLTANYNALDERVSSLENGSGNSELQVEVNGLKSEVNELSKDVSDNSADIQSLSNVQSTQSARIEAVSINLSNVTGRVQTLEDTKGRFTTIIDEVYFGGGWDIVEANSLISNVPSGSIAFAHNTEYKNFPLEQLINGHLSILFDMQSSSSTGLIFENGTVGFADVAIRLGIGTGQYVKLNGTISAVINVVEFNQAIITFDFMGVVPGPITTMTSFNFIVTNCHFQSSKSFGNVVPIQLIKPGQTLLSAICKQMTTFKGETV